ncbi:MAG: sigma-70 family RNA polymerase sigma factor [Firmicutes bacterium]|nr:sigma-70 family RNA polymerase sigma factor [Bacillota bacterium]
MSLGYSEEKSDDALYQQYLHGDTASYDELMIRYGDRLTFYLYGYLHDYPDAEDMMIEAFARIMAKRPKIGEGAFKAYLFKTARNLALRHHERKSRLQVFSIDGLDGELADIVLATGTAVSGSEGFRNVPAGLSNPVEDDFGHEERKRILHLCLNRIEPELKEALWLIYFEDMSYNQAASVMKVSSKRIDHLLQRGKRQMRIELAKEGMTNAYA